MSGEEKVNQQSGLSFEALLPLSNRHPTLPTFPSLTKVETDCVLCGIQASPPLSNVERTTTALGRCTLEIGVAFLQSQHSTSQ